MASLLSMFKKRVEQGWDQLNPTDNGRTWQNPQGNAPQQQARGVAPPSTFQQVTHNNPVVNVARKQVINPLAQSFQHTVQSIPEIPSSSPARFLNNAVIRPIKTTDTHIAQAAQGKNPYHGSTKQQIGQGLQDAINISSVVPIGKGAQLAARGGKVLPRVSSAAKSGAKVGGGFGVAQGTSTALSQNQNLPQTLKTAGINAAIGAAGGAALGAAIPLAGAAGKAGGRAVDNRVSLNASGGIGKDIKRPSLPASKSPETPLTPDGVPIKGQQGSGFDEIAFNKKADLIRSKIQAIKPDKTTYDGGGNPVGVYSPEKQAKLDILDKKMDSHYQTRRDYQAQQIIAKSQSSAPVNTQQYLNQQIKAQKVARKAGQPTGLNRIKAPLSDAKTKLIDSLAPIEGTLNQKVTAKNATAHITPQLDRVLRADTIGAQYIKDNGLAKVIQNAPNTKELDQYLIAKHSADLEKNGITTGRNSAADANLVKQLGSKYEPHAQALKQYSQGLLDTATNYGLISKELSTHLKEKYPNYVPVNRIFGEDELQGAPKGIGAGKASIGKQTVVQKIKGSTRQIESPLSSLVDKTVQVVKEGERNKAAQILTGYRDLPGNPFQLRELSKSEAIGTKPVVSVIENGETRRFETTREIADAAKSLNKEQLGLVGRVLSVPTRVLRLGATGLNPAFALSNVTKDSVSAFINGSHPLRASVLNPKVFVEALKASVNHESGAYGELVRQGAGGTSFDISRNAPVQNVRAIRMAKNAPSKVLYTVTKPSQLLRAAENAIGRSEEFNRALQYYANKQAALKGGASIEQAQILGAHAARNNTVNFARAGDFGRVANSVLPYLNAGIQGSRTLLRNLKERPAQTTAKLAITAFFPTAVVTAWNTSDPERKAAYDDIKPYEKQGSLIIVPPHPVKDDNGKWNVIKIPVSQEIANLNDIVRNGVETAVGDGSIKLADLLGNAVGTVTSINASTKRQVYNQITPQGLKPGLEDLTNQNLFTGNAIVPESQKNLPGPDQIGKSTTGTATQLGKLLNLSPRKIDNFISTTGAGLGQNAVNLSDKALASSGVIKPDQVKGKSFSTSIAGRFKGAQGQSIYDMADKDFEKYKKQLTDTPGYKALPVDEKAKALNRLQSTVSGANIPKFNKDGSQKTLSLKEQSIASGKPDINSFLTPQTSGGNTKEYNTKPDAQYQAAKKSYDTNKSSYTEGQRIKKESELARLKVGSTYDKNIRDLYGLSKSQVYDYVSKDQNGKATVDKLLAYDNDLVKNGIIAKPKFKDKNGAVSIVPKTSGSGGKGKKAKATKFSTAGLNTAKIKAAKAPKGVKVRKLAKAPKARTRKLSVSKLPKVS